MPLTPADYRKTAYIHRRGTRATQPAAADVLPGTLYFVTDELITERSTGSAWQSYSGGAVPSFTTGSVIFANPGLAEDNANFFWDNTAKQLGIGTNAPAYGLYVAGANVLYTGAGSVSGGFTTINIGGGISSGDTTITVVSTTGYPNKGIIQIESEMITYTGKTGTTFTGCTRGRFNSTAAAHANGTPVIYFGYVCARDDTAGSAILAAPIGRLYVNANGTFTEHGGSAISVFIAGFFQVSGNYASYSNGTIHTMLGTGFIGNRSNHDLSFRTNNTNRLFIDINGRLQFAGQTASFPALIRNAAVLEVKLADNSDFANLKAKELVISSGTVMMRSSAAMTNGAAANAGTLNNAPAVGDPTKWIPFDDNGTTRYIPAW